MSDKCKFCGAAPQSSEKAQKHFADGTCNNCLYDMHWAAKNRTQVIFINRRPNQNAAVHDADIERQRKQPE
mgnify:CR=1 FL=1